MASGQSPDLFAYGILAYELCSSGDVEGLSEWPREYDRESGIIPDRVIYNSLLFRFFRASRINDYLNRSSIEGLTTS